jgi:hypothetical protein
LRQCCQGSIGDLEWFLLNGMTPPPPGDAP